MSIGMNPDRPAVVLRTIGCINRGFIMRRLLQLISNNYSVPNNPFVLINLGISTNRSRFPQVRPSRPGSVHEAF